MTNTEKKKYYFASDLHLGLYPQKNSLEREKKFVKWLDEKQSDAAGFFLVGDIFDFWWEYKKVIPKGFSRFFGKIAEITDSGIPVHFFIGNHDIWMHQYFQDELGIILHKKIFRTELYGQKFFISHGDGLGKGDLPYKMLRRIFTNPVLQWLYSRLHPNLGLSIGHAWSKKSRYAKGFKEEYFGPDKERLIQFAENQQKKENIDYYIFGHRHLPLVHSLSPNGKIIYLGDWVANFSYGVYDGKNFSLNYYQASSD